MINVDAELSKYKNCRDRDELERRITEYKNLALKNANNMITAGKYSTVALKLKEICDKLPAPRLKKLAGGAHDAQVKTATITNEENSQINADWEKRAKNTGGKR